METEVSEAEKRLLVKKKYLERLNYDTSRGLVDHSELYALVKGFFTEFLGLDYEFTYEELSKELNKLFIKPNLKKNIDQFLFDLTETEYLEGNDMNQQEALTYMSRLKAIIENLITDAAIESSKKSFLQKLFAKKSGENGQNISQNVQGDAQNINRQSLQNVNQQNIMPQDINQQDIALGQQNNLQQTSQPAAKPIQDKTIAEAFARSLMLPEEMPNDLTDNNSKASNEDENPYAQPNTSTLNTSASNISASDFSEARPAKKHDDDNAKLLGKKSFEMKSLETKNLEMKKDMPAIQNEKKEPKKQKVSKPSVVPVIMPVQEKAAQPMLDVDLPQLPNELGKYQEIGNSSSIDLAEVEKQNAKAEMFKSHSRTPKSVVQKHDPENNVLMVADEKHDEKHEIAHDYLMREDNTPSIVQLKELMEESYFSIVYSNTEVAKLKYLKALELYHNLSLTDKKSVYIELYELYSKIKNS